ncbi:MAG: Holliday junction resolvase RuvX [Mycoplasmataceae bacterium]|jgi:putative Holliday junction resolvase|nr:Holliday junction resolvase RuvX [Mycoplasmataceae bacterium]
MRLLGVDLGTKTMGLAITDSLQIVASGLENFYYDNNDLNICVEKIKKIISKYNDIGTIVIGYPLKLNGSKNERTYLVENFFTILKKNINNKILVVFHDERFTTKKATEILKEQVKMKNSKIKKIKDKMSAVVILDEFMNKI